MRLPLLNPCLLQPKNHANHNEAQYKPIKKITFTLIISALSLSAVGCNTLQALEPTAILISDIKSVI